MQFLHVSKHLSDNLHVALMNHARAYKCEVDGLLTTIIRHGSNGVVRVALGHIVVVHIRISNHRLDNLVQINDKLSRVASVVIREKRWVITRLKPGNTRFCLVNETLEGPLGVVHALVNHDLDTALRDLQRLNQRLTVGNTD